MDYPELLEFSIGLITRDKAAWAKLLALGADKTLNWRESRDFKKLERYFTGVYSAEDSLGDAVHLSARLFSDDSKRREYAGRIFDLVLQTETEQKIDYMIDSTRQLILGNIPVDGMFRLFWAIVHSLPEDLEYLKSIAATEDEYEGNMNVLALAQNGLMIQTELDANRDVDKQLYAVTALGRAVDYYALSANDDKRQKWYKNHSDKAPVLT